MLCGDEDLLIVFHSMTGGSRQMAQAARAARGDRSWRQVRLLRAAEAGPDDVLAADGYLFVTPENLAAMSGMMKDFFDRCYYAALDRINGRPYASLICAGSDGTQRGAADRAHRHRLAAEVRSAEPLIVCTHAQTPKPSCARSRSALPT